MKVASTLGMPHQTPDNWIRADKLGKLSAAGERIVTIKYWQGQLNTF